MSNPRRALSMIVVALALLITSACSSNEPDFDSVSRDDTSDSGSDYKGFGSGSADEDDPYPYVDPETTDELFVDALRNDEFSYEFSDSTDEELVKVGQTICNTIDDGTSFETLYYQGQEAGFTADATSTLIGFAVGAYCPENDYVFE